MQIKLIFKIRPMIIIQKHILNVTFCKSLINMNVKYHFLIFQENAKNKYITCKLK